MPLAQARAMMQEYAGDRVCLDCGRDVETECRCRNEEENR